MPPSLQYRERFVFQDICTKIHRELKLRDILFIWNPERSKIFAISPMISGIQMDRNYFTYLYDRVDTLGRITSEIYG